MVTCWHCKAEHPEAHHARVVDNHTPLYGPWTGWRMVGRYLVSPDRDRISPERLRGILWRDLADLRKMHRTVKIHGSVIIPAMERFAGSA